MTQAAASLTPAGRNSTADAPKTLGGLWWTMVTRGSPRILICLVLGFGACRLSMGGWSWVDAVIPFLIAAWWPFQEWLIHTHLLHFRPRKVGPFTIDFFQAKKHRRHHRSPWDFGDLSIPLFTYASAVPALCLIAYLGRDVPAVFTAITVFVAFGLHYEFCHFMAHSNYVPRSKLYKTAWRNHRLHHFKNEGYWMGVSTNIGDRVLGTCPEQKSVPKSPTCLTLGIDPPA